MRYITNKEVGGAMADDIDEKTGDSVADVLLETSGEVWMCPSPYLSEKREFMQISVSMSCTVNMLLVVSPGRSWWR
jgi:hypothetical protein